MPPPERPDRRTEITTGRDARRTLPAESTPLVGRERDLELATRLFESSRILTLFGPGGVGKTRLAHRLATTLAPGFADGVRLVELAPVRDQGAVPAAVGDALDVQQRPEPVAARLDRRAARRAAAAARARQLRARARHDERARGADPAVVPQRARAGDEPRTARHPGRGRVVGAAAPGSGEPRRAARDARRDPGRAAVRRTGARRAQRLRARRDDRRSRSRRSASGSTACRSRSSSPRRACAR